jgi:hypothetical protein
MPITYTWKLTGLKKKNVNSLQGFVCQTYWKKIGTNENGVTGEFSGATPFTPEADTDVAEFTSFEDLTEDQVLGWIKSVVVDDYEKHVNEQIRKQIDLSADPETQVDEGKFPWESPDPESVVT